MEEGVRDTCAHGVREMDQKWTCENDKNGKLICPKMETRDRPKKEGGHVRAEYVGDRSQ